MLKTSIFPNRYWQGAGAIGELAPALKKLGSRALLICGRTAARDLLPDIARAAKAARLRLTVEAFGGECSEAEIKHLAAIARAKRCDVVAALGGGKCLDTGKTVAHIAGARCVIVPTIASTDAPCSAVSVIYTPKGEFQRYLFFPKNPDLVLVDTAVIARAPVRLLVAGIGDALSTWFEADACRQAGALNQAGGHGTLAAYAIARLCYDTILEFGVPACRACETQAVTPALDRVVEANTLLSGLGFESAGLASAHSIHNGLTILPGTHEFYHGEKVAIGVLAGLFLGDRPRALMDEVYAFCESVGLPATLAQIGLPDAGEADLRRVAAHACAKGETIFHEPSPITPERVFNCLKAADAYGRARRKSG